MKKPDTYTSKELDDILDSISPEEDYQIKQRMLLAIKIKNSMLASGLNKIRFAERMGKRPSEITKWLSGAHNFTVDTLFDIQRILNTNLVDVSVKPKEQVNVFNVFLSSSVSDLQAPAFSQFHYNQVAYYNSNQKSQKQPKLVCYKS